MSVTNELSREYGETTDGQASECERASFPLPPSPKEEGEKTPAPRAPILMRVQENVEVTHDPLQMEGGCRCERRGPFGGSHPFHAQQPAGETQALPNVTLRAIEWRDLVALTPLEKAWELGLGLPWLILSLWCYGGGWWWAGLACSFYVFLTGLRQSHNAQHYSLGLPRRLQDCVLFALSLLMLASMHAVQVTHLHHHRHCLEDADGEGATARLPWWRALLVGPLFYTRLHLSACRLGNREKRAWIARELIGIVFVIGFTFCLPAWSALRWHVAAMLAGECFTGFFAVWTVHRGCGVHEPGRTQRGRWLNLISYSMFFHAEHHLFPAVPTAHLAELAGRLDAVMPQIGQRTVLPFGAALPANKHIAGI